jgi:hypothetical protein
MCGTEKITSMGCVRCLVDKLTLFFWIVGDSDCELSYICSLWFCFYIYVCFSYFPSKAPHLQVRTFQFPWLPFAWESNVIKDSIRDTWEKWKSPELWHVPRHCWRTDIWRWGILPKAGAEATVEKGTAVLSNRPEPLPLSRDGQGPSRSFLW